MIQKQIPHCETYLLCIVGRSLFKCSICEDMRPWGGVFCLHWKLCGHWLLDRHRAVRVDQVLGTGSNWAGGVAQVAQLGGPSGPGGERATSANPTPAAATQRQLIFLR